jgi:hypothetical protein
MNAISVFSCWPGTSFQNRAYWDSITLFWIPDNTVSSIQLIICQQTRWRGYKAAESFLWHQCHLSVWKFETFLALNCCCSRAYVFISQGLAPCFSFLWSLSFFERWEKSNFISPFLTKYTACNGSSKIRKLTKKSTQEHKSSLPY